MSDISVSFDMQHTITFLLPVLFQGSMSVFFHMLSDMSRGLFRRAISQSGVSTYAGAIWPRVSGGKYLRTLVKKAYGNKDGKSQEYKLYVF